MTFRHDNPFTSTGPLQEESTRHRATNWSNVGFMSTGTLEIDFSEIWIKYEDELKNPLQHDDVIKWIHFPRN